MLIEYHRTMLADSVRNAAFHEALKQIIKPGMSVADIGAGTGILGFMAKKLGAKDVYFYENASILSVAQRLAKANGLKNCHFINAHSTDILDPPLVDIVVSETLGNYAFEENIISTLNDAKRFLKPGGVILPEAVMQYVCPVVSSTYYTPLTIWDHVGYGLDYSLAKEMSLNNIYVRTFSPSDLWNEGRDAAAWDTLAFKKKNSAKRQGKAAWTFDRPATVYGMAIWWTCQLTPDIALSTSPLAPKNHWEQLYFPVTTPISLKSEGRLEVNISSHSTYAKGTDIAWRFSHNGTLLQSMNLRRGYLA